MYFVPWKSLSFSLILISPDSASSWAQRGYALVPNKKIKAKKENTYWRNLRGLLSWSSWLALMLCHHHCPACGVVGRSWWGKKWLLMWNFGGNHGCCFNLFVFSMWCYKCDKQQVTVNLTVYPTLTFQQLTTTWTTHLKFLYVASTTGWTMMTTQRQCQSRRPWQRPPQIASIGILLIITQLTSFTGRTFLFLFYR